MLSTNLVWLRKHYQYTQEEIAQQDDAGIVIPPKGKHFFGAVTVGERGQIVIPQEARRIFKISAGDKILILGDEERGLAIVHQRDVINFVSELGVPKNEKD